MDASTKSDLPQTISSHSSESEALSLLLFVNLALAAEADKELEVEQLNRTHHRILFLVDYRPGVTIGEIVSLLRLTPQAVRGPLRTLIEHGLVRQEASNTDRRKRYLFTTADGDSLLTAVTKPQSRRISAALEIVGATKAEGFMAFMRVMMNTSDREWLYPPEKSGKRARRLPK